MEMSKFCKGISFSDILMKIISYFYSWIIGTNKVVQTTTTENNKLNFYVREAFVLRGFSDEGINKNT